MNIYGLQKLTLLDYPGHTACTVFTKGCNFKCPYCHNQELAWGDPEPLMSQGRFFQWLETRKGVLDGVAISGGEPTLQGDLVKFMKHIHEMEFKVKLDTNGAFPRHLKQIFDAGVVDYIAMDVKPGMINHYTTDSIALIMSSGIDYEFRTTVVREFHSKEDLVEAARMIKGAKNYYLQQFVDSGRCIEAGFTAYSREEMLELQKEVQKIIPNVQLRGV